MRDWTRFKDNCVHCTGMNESIKGGEKKHTTTILNMGKYCFDEKKDNK